MSETVYASYRDASNNWSQIEVTSDAKNDKVFSIKNYSGTHSVMAWVSEALDTRVYVVKVETDGTITPIDGTGYITITSGSGHDIFLNFTRGQQVVYIGVYGETGIYKYNTGDMTAGTPITTEAPTDPIKAMKIDKNGLLTALSGDNLVNQYDVNNSDSHDTDEQVLFASGTYLFNETTAVYFDVNNYLVCIAQKVSDSNFVYMRINTSGWANVETVAFNTSINNIYDASVNMRVGVDMLVDPFDNVICLFSMRPWQGTGIAAAITMTVCDFFVPNKVSLATEMWGDVGNLGGNMVITIHSDAARLNPVGAVTVTPGEGAGTYNLAQSNNSGIYGTVTVDTFNTNSDDFTVTGGTGYVSVLTRNDSSISTSIIEDSGFSPLSSLNCNYLGDYIYSKTHITQSLRDIKKYITDGGSGDLSAGTTTFLVHNISNRAFRGDITGYDVSSTGTAGR